MNWKLVLVISVAVALAISIMFATYTPITKHGVEETNTTTIDQTTIETTSTETVTETKPLFRTKPLTTSMEEVVNVCELDVIDITVVLRSNVTRGEYEEFIVISGYVSIRRKIYEQGVELLVKKIIIDNPSDYYKRGFEILAEGLAKVYEEPRTVPWGYSLRESIRIETPYYDEIWNEFQPGSKHKVTIVYIYYGVECVVEAEFEILPG